MSKKDKGHVKIFTVAISTTEDFMYRGYSEGAFDHVVDEPESGAREVGGETDSTPKVEPETKKTQIEKPQVLSIYNSGGMRI